MSEHNAFCPRATLSDCERSVWAAGYVQHCDDPMHTAQYANGSVGDLLRLLLDAATAMDVESDAARSGASSTEAEFAGGAAWRVACAALVDLSPIPRRCRQRTNQFQLIRDELPLAVTYRR